VCTIAVDAESVQALKKRWMEWGLTVPIDVVESPYREIGLPLVSYLHEIDREKDQNVPTLVVLPEFVVSHWWAKLLHNQTSVAIREALYHDQIERGRGRPVINVPYRIGDERYEPSLVDLLPVLDESVAV